MPLDWQQLGVQWPQFKSSFALTDIQVQQPSKDSVPIDITVLIKKAPLAAPSAGQTNLAPDVSASPSSGASTTTTSPNKAIMPWMAPCLPSDCQQCNQKENKLRRFL
eukprot:s3802_g4.t1